MDYTTYARDPVYYFPDGNIYIAVRKTLFRVYRGLLARHSIVFHDLFDIPPPTDGSDSSEGVAVVNLSDTLSEIRMLLKFVYGDIACCESIYCSEMLEIPFGDLENILRVSHKYDVKRLYGWALENLHQYPSTNDASQSNFLTSVEWWKYKDPDFLVRLIKLTQLVDRQQLDGQSALAYYAMCVVDWQTHDEGYFHQQLDAGIVSQLARGKNRVLSRSVSIMEAIMDHRCKRDTPFHNLDGTVAMRTTWNENECEKAKAAAIKALMPEVHRDFGHALASYRSPQVMVGCKVASLVRSGVPMIFDPLIEDFGFRNEIHSLP
ncbi:hypothetical protein FRB93_007422 [Tulasnella sp. JGI-2019a]|nr:hypothetical protein FRB93_007422 [Tulasnella sp. JGI-2019a]